MFKYRKTDMDTQVAAIGQAVMQNCRHRSLKAPVQFALTMKITSYLP